MCDINNISMKVKKKMDIVIAYEKIKNKQLQNCVFDWFENLQLV